MATITLGMTPDRLKVILVADADFLASLRRKDDADWPQSQVILDFGAIEWPATIQASTAVWNVNEDDVNALIEARPREVRLWYIEGDQRILWALGDVEIQRGER